MSEKELVVITGAASGIGFALGKEFEKRGYAIIGLDQNPEVEKIWEKSIIVDVSNESSVIQAAQQILKEFNRPAIWINNAGITRLGSFETTPSAEFDRVMGVNFSGIVYGTRAALSIMHKPRAGVIVNMASMSGLLAAPFMTAYSASKHAVVGFTRALELEEKQMKGGIRYVLVMPGFVDTPIMSEQGGMSFPKQLQFMVDQPGKAAVNIVDGILSGKTEIIPTTNGKFLYAFYRALPGLAMRSSKMMTAKNFRQFIGLEPVQPKKNEP